MSRFAINGAKILVGRFEALGIFYLEEFRSHRLLLPEGTLALASRARKDAEFGGKGGAFSR